jgi:hypothetical protein
VGGWVGSVFEKVPTKANSIDYGNKIEV